MMKKIKREHVVGFFTGLLTVLLMELIVNTDKYVEAFQEGFNVAQY